jgi:uncharacterized 2Fe-2S/4Fe-4S cluster protein (DUF4445 family)
MAYGDIMYNGYMSKGEEVNMTETLQEVTSEVLIAEDTSEQLVTKEQVIAELRAKYEEGALEDRLIQQMSQEVINPIMLARYLGIRPQQVYQAIRAGSIAAVRENNTQKLYIEFDEACRYAAQYLDRKARRALQVKLAEDLAQAAS